MKLFFTDVSQDLTKKLAAEAQKLAQEGKRVFYIAPNSLSFEKERKVLSSLPQKASFAITVTRFGQMARYFLLKDANSRASLDDKALAMLFFRVLSQFEEDDLKVYGRLRKDANVIHQLIDLYKELKTAHMTIEDLCYLEQIDKAQDLTKIFLAVEDYLRENHFDNQSKLSRFGDQIQSGQLDQQLEKTVLIIDGFTRFSAEEEYLIDLLHGRCSDIIIGVYASQKAYRTNFIQGNIYQASVEFLRHLAQRFGVKPLYLGDMAEQTSFSRLTAILESRHDFSQTDLTLTDEDKESIQIWEVVNQREEIIQVARQIRQLLAKGIRYKEILVLLGDVDSYHLQVKKLFDKFDIPYYFGKAESMSHHPLVNVIDALERIKRYNFRAEDVLNVLKSGLIGRFTQEEIDRFEQYVIFADIQGLAKFNRDFTANLRQKRQRDAQGHLQVTDRYQLDHLNQIRHQLITPLVNFLKVRPQKGDSLLKKFSQLLEEFALTTNFEKLVQGVDEGELDQHEQVWSCFVGLLEQMHRIFGTTSLSVADFLSLLKSGMMAAEYRTVPATVDVVNIKSYDLVEPHSAKYVFALGMTRSHFPKNAQNKSLLTDQERALINEKTEDATQLSIVGADNLKKNHFAALSLFNAASHQLVLSLPQVLNESADEISPYLKELLAIGLTVEERGSDYQASSDQIGNYKDLLSTIIAVNQSQLFSEMTREEQTFWAVAVRYLRRQMAEQALEFPEILGEIKTKPVSEEVMAIVFPKNQPIALSVTALTAFYNNQYLYFLRYVLGLQESETLKPDARVYGTYLHRIFERLFRENLSSAHFDASLERAISETNQEDHFKQLFQADNQESYLSQVILEDMARSTASLFREMQSETVKDQEKAFDFLLAGQAKVKGIIDRVDILPASAGDNASMKDKFSVVDYKSSDRKFHLNDFYNGLNSQLVTYLQAVKEAYGIETDQLLGAMYLHMQNPIVQLAKTKSQEDVLTQNIKALTYQGLFSEEDKVHLANGAYSYGQHLYNQAQLDTLLTYNQTLFAKAIATIRSGSFAINPYTKDGKSVAGEQLKAITHFEADQHLLTNARRLKQLPRKGQGIDKIEALALMEEENGR
ncbi:ATP-dependent nuclease subunit B [Streptococcus plurextorum]|uniref:ATP-dependent nuclease subunit B n=1 Tax=Streptococcus plurextorum TaxID=456876 RepID=UPI000401750C|nr:ATP-dependent nuclease subunit B [Streptococcus plurextorum]